MGLAGADLWLLSVVLAWGTGTVASKYLVQVIPPLALFCGRGLAIALVLCLGVKLFTRRRMWEGGPLLWAYLLSGVLLAAQNLTFYWALHLTTASQGVLLISTSPLWTAFLVAALGLERLRPSNWLGAALALSGLALVVFGAPPASAEYAPAPLLGGAVMLLSAVLAALFMVASKGWMHRFGSLRMMAGAFAVGSVLALPAALPQLLSLAWGELSWLHWLVAAYLVVGAGSYGFAVWYRQIRLTSSARVAVYQYLVPPVAVLLAAVLLGERLNLGQGVGMLVTLIGVYLARPPLRPSPPASAPDC